MIYDKTLLNSFKNQVGFSVSGCKRLFLTDSKNVRSYQFEGRQIKQLSMVGSFSVMEHLGNLNFSVKAEQSKNGPVYRVEITFSIAGLKADTNYMLDDLINSELTAIVEDKSGRYWLAGFAQGMVSDYEYQTDEGGYSVKMTTSQLNKPEEVASAAMASLDFSEDDGQVTPAPIFTVPSTGSGSGSGSVASKNLNVTVVNTQNYQITLDDEFLLLPVPYAVFLPMAAPKGKSYIIKADYNAELTPSQVKVAGGDIDGAMVYTLDADRASLTVVYDGAGSWHAVSFSL